MIGKTLSHFEITAKLGEGGMGEVYRAEDTQLDREVAIKVLPEAFANDPERMARFEREAKVLASLNHPYIAGIYEVGSDDGVHFLAMEMAEGEDLSVRIERGALQVDEALRIALQVAEALSAAHEKAIVHRDLKPANVMVAPDGGIKVLDFGLAKPGPAEARDGTLTQSPTLTAQMTQAGVILGTAAYMSPEQARGQAVDKKADIWAFGCVLYEMLSGKRPFGGQTVTDTLVAILEREPDWEFLPAATPPQVRGVIRRCLERDARRRLHDIADARIEIEDALDSASGGQGIGTEAPHAGQPPRQWIPWAVAALSLAAAAWGLWTGSSARSPLGSDSSASPRLSRLLIPTDPLLTDQRAPALAVSRDGRRIVYSARRDGPGQLWVRDLDSLEATPLAGTEGAVGPFFSPDGDRVGFAADGWLSTISVRGGPPNPLQQLAVYLGGDWGEGDTLVYGEWPTRHLWQIPSGGGVPHALTDPLPDVRYYIEVAPKFVTGARALVFNNFNAFTSPGEPILRVKSLDSEEQVVLAEAGTNAHYAPTGHLVFAKGGSLLAAPFDAERLELAGSAVVVLGDVLTNIHGAAQFDISDTGTLIYVQGELQRPEHRLVWVDRQGATAPITEEMRPYWGPRLSPDASHVAVWIAEDRPQIWTYDLLRGGLSRVTSEGSNFWSLWTPDGEALTFASRQEDGTGFLARQRADRATPPEPLVGADHPVVEQPLSWADGGASLVFQRGTEEAEGFDIWTTSLAPGAEPRPLVRSVANEFQGILSPDGKWLAYVSDESGRREIYARPFPVADRTIPISTQGGEEPLWAPSGRELFYRADGKMMVVDIETDPDLRPSRPRPLFEDRFVRGTPYGRNYDIDHEGERFLMIESAATGETATAIIVVQNWFEELKRLVPTSR